MMRAILLAACAAILAAGCVYKGGKVVDGTNLAIGIKIPGTEWNVSVLDYIGGIRVAGQDSTHITVTNEVAETNIYFGVVTTLRSSKMTADIEPFTGYAPTKVESHSRLRRNDITLGRRLLSFTAAARWWVPARFFSPHAPTVGRAADHARHALK